jgi:hypothetical protein
MDLDPVLLSRLQFAFVGDEPTAAFPGTVGVYWVFRGKVRKGYG